MVGLPPMWPGFDSRTRRQMWVEFAVGFSPGTPLFPSPQKPTSPNSNSIWSSRATDLSVGSYCFVLRVMRASMWPGFDSQTRRQMWVEFVVGSRPCSERFFSGYSGFPLSSKTNISKFQFDLEFEGHRFVTRIVLLRVTNHLLKFSFSLI